MNTSVYEEVNQHMRGSWGENIQCGLKIQWLNEGSWHQMLIKTRVNLLVLKERYQVEVVLMSLENKDR